MNQPTEPAADGPMTYAWVGLFIGFILIALVIWNNTLTPVHNNENIESNPNVVELTSANWQKEVMESRIPVVVDFWAPWCGPCLQFAPTIDKLATTYAGRVKFGKVNVDEVSIAAAREIEKKHDIKGIPHLFIFKGGRLAAAPIVGVKSETYMTSVIDEVLQVN